MAWKKAEAFKLQGGSGALNHAGATILNHVSYEYVCELAEQLNAACSYAHDDKIDCGLKLNELEEENAKLKAENEQLQETVKLCEIEIDKLKAENERLKKALKTADETERAEVYDLKKENERLKKIVSDQEKMQPELDGVMSDLDAEIGQLKKENERLQAEVQELLTQAELHEKMGQVWVGENERLKDKLRWRKTSEELPEQTMLAHERVECIIQMLDDSDWFIDLHSVKDVRSKDSRAVYWRPWHGPESEKEKDD